MTDRRALQGMITGFRLSAALNVAAELGLSDLLVGGPRTVTELAAEATSADPDTLRRLLRALATVRGLRRPAGTKATPTPIWAGTSLRRTGNAPPARPDAELSIRPELWSAWGQLGHSDADRERTRSSRRTVWTSGPASAGATPTENEIFNQNMTPALTSSVAAAVAEAYDFSGTGPRSWTSVGDRGIPAPGGRAQPRHPHVSGTVFDQANVVVTTRPPRSHLRWTPRWSRRSAAWLPSRRCRRRTSIC